MRSISGARAVDEGLSAIFPIMKLQWSLSLMGLELYSEKKIGISPAAFHGSSNARTNFSSSYFQVHHFSYSPALMTFTSGLFRSTAKPMTPESSRNAGKKENEKYVNELEKISKGWTHFLGGIFVALFFLSDANPWLEYHYHKVIIEEYLSNEDVKNRGFC